MFTIYLSEGPIDVDNPEVQQQCYNNMMNRKEKAVMFQLEVDFIMLDTEFGTLKEAKPWVQIALDAGAWMVAIFCEGKVIEAYG